MKYLKIKIMKTEIMKARVEHKLSLLTYSQEQIKKMIEKYWDQASYINTAKGIADYIHIAKQNEMYRH